MSFELGFAAIDSIGAIIVLATIVVAIAIIFAAHVVLRPEWRFAWRNALILALLVVDLLISLRTFEPAFLRADAPWVEPGTELLYCFLIPLAVSTAGLFLWPYMREANDDMPLSWTIWPQSFRTIGGIFLVYGAAGHMPLGFALPAGVGDLAVGLSAPWMTRYATRADCRKELIVLWNALGILDFVVAFATGFAFNTPTEYPLVLVPGFLVPLALGFHLHSLRKLKLQTG